MSRAASRRHYYTLANFRSVLSSLVLLNSIVPQTIESESTIKVSRFLVPDSARAGELARLSCIYELQGELLQTMKMFKDDKEFYRYSPRERPEDVKMVFATPGIKVILARSNESDVVLSVNKASAGVYRCQVTVEGSFRSIKAEKRMEVVESAPWNKLITGSRLGAGALGQNRQQQQRHTVHQQSQHYGVINNNNIASSSFRGQQQHQKHARPGASSGANGAPAGEPVWVPIQLLLYISMSLMTNVAISASVWRLAASY